VRIAYDHQIFQMQTYGGVSRYFVELAKGISLAPDTWVKVVSPLYINSYLAEASRGLSVLGRHVPRARYTGRLVRQVNRRLTPPLLSHVHPDLVHETYYSDEPVSPTGAKTVLTVYDMIYELFPHNFASSARLSARKRHAVERADHVICISERTRQDLIAMLDVDPAKTTVVHLGLSLTRPPASDTEAAVRPFLLHVGDRGGHKNFATLLRAYAASRSLQDGWDLVAFGGGQFTPQELTLVSHLGIEPERVRHASGDDSDLARAYQQAAVFVCPSLYEGFGMPPLEAMSFGCPVVSSDAGSLPEVVGDAAMLFEPGSAADLTGAMERVLGDTEFRHALVEKGRERVSLFSWERCAQETLSVYQRLLS
jgi:glycosyltransferase involved in cell wall biosynthesis